ncbi:MAG: phosphoenolpyruvate--protein phosphotransferase [Deltaproteobacteria bacterium]
MKGLGVSGGIAIGQVVALERLSTEIYPQRILKPEEVPGELRRFESAVRDAKAQLKQVKTMIGPGHPLKNHLYILDTHLLLLEDRMFFQGTRDIIASERQNAEWALSTIISTISAAFDTIEDEYLRERAGDVHFVGERVLRILMGYSEKGSIPFLPPNSVIVAHDLSPADTLQIEKESVLGFAIEMGGRTSHTAIIARSMKLPAVTGLENISRQVQTGETIIIDGSTGMVIVNPDPETIFRFRQHQEVYRNYHQGLMTFGRLPAVTSDGAGSVRIMANIELMDEIDLALDHGAEGIGLFRTEYLFLGRRDLPSEEEQYDAYRHVVGACASNSVTIRTLDVGADKIASSLNIEAESNPAMGLRAIRLCLGRKDLFKTQLRAILRASAHGQCRLLVPMISCMTELRTTKEIIEEVKEELAREGKAFDPHVPLGILVEVPSAVAIADLIARETDFFSIGTNDLIQYALAIDRVNEHVNYLYDTLHPALLRLVRQIANAGQASGIPVAMCGEMAGYPVNIPILLGLGLDELSMNALSIPMVKKFIRSVSMEECQELTARAFDMTAAQEIRGFLEDWIQERFPQDYFIDQS